MIERGSEELSKEWHMLRLQSIWVQKAAFNKHRNLTNAGECGDAYEVIISSPESALKENSMKNQNVCYSRLKWAYFGATTVETKDSNNALTSNSQRK